MIYDNIEKICKDRGMSIRELEMQAGLGNGTIGRWKDGDPRVGTLQSVADVLDVPVASLLESNKEEP